MRGNERIFDPGSKSHGVLSVKFRPAKLAFDKQRKLKPLYA